MLENKDWVLSAEVVKMKLSERERNTPYKLEDMVVKVKEFVALEKKDWVLSAEVVKMKLSDKERSAAYSVEKVVVKVKDSERVLGIVR